MVAPPGRETIGMWVWELRPFFVLWLVIDSLDPAVILFEMHRQRSRLNR